MGNFHLKIVFVIAKKLQILGLKMYFRSLEFAKQNTAKTKHEIKLCRSNKATKPMYPVMVKKLHAAIDLGALGEPPKFSNFNTAP